MPEILFELGCEELPAGSVERATQNLQDGIAKRLDAAGLTYEPLPILFTPRRMIVGFRGVGEVQPDQNVVQRGPGIASAFDGDGKPTKALEGFCKGQGVDPSEVVREGDYVWVKKTVSGKRTTELLAEILPAAVSELTFAKTMRWANSSFRFARPIRWILASFDQILVEFIIEGVESGLQSKGHRFRSPDFFEVRTYDNLVQGLRDRFVEPSFAERSAKIHDGAKTFLSSSEPDSGLVAENANLTEWPEPLLGEFKPEFLALPIPVLRTVMAKHERFFPVPDASGVLSNKFVSIRNGGEESAVRDGNAWVLNARFNDARFFFEEDKKRSLSDFLEKTSGMAFQEKLGSVRQRCDRLSKLAAELAILTGADSREEEFARQAGLYAKADLTTGLVSELDELQGVIGGEYAKREGFEDAVCWALASHYDLTKNSEIDCEGSRAAVRLLMADQLDRIAGFVGIGLIPTGSSDPFGLRRSVTLLIEAAWNWPVQFDGYAKALETAFKLYRDQGFQLDEQTADLAIKEVFKARFQAMSGIRHDLCDAALLSGDELLNPRAVRMRFSVMSLCGSDIGFVQTATRPANIVSAALKKGIALSEVDPDANSLGSKEAELLWEAVQKQKSQAKIAADGEDSEAVVNALRPLCDPINTFFDSTMVMVEDERIRNARLKMLYECDQVLRTAGDFSKVVIEG